MPPPVTPKKKKPPPAAVPRKKAAVAPPVAAKKKAVAPPPPKKKEAVPPPPAKRKVAAPPPTEKEEPATTTEPETVPAAVEAVSAAAEATPAPIASSSTTRETESASVEGSEKPEKVPAPTVHQDTVTTVPEAAPSTSAAVANAPVAVKDDAADEQVEATTTEENENLSDQGDTPSAPPIPGDGKDAAPDDPPATSEAHANTVEASPGEDIPDGSKVDETETQQVAERVEQPAKEKKTPVVIPDCVQCEHEGHITKSKWWIPELSEFLCADVSCICALVGRSKNTKTPKTAV